MSELTDLNVEKVQHDSKGLKLVDAPVAGAPSSSDF
jgi:hypothetical protein